MTTTTIIEIRTGGVLRSSGQRISTGDAEALFLKSLPIAVEIPDIAVPTVIQAVREQVFVWSIRLKGREIARARLDRCDMSCPLWTFQVAGRANQSFSACGSVGECMADESLDQMGLFGEVA